MRRVDDIEAQERMSLGESAAPSVSRHRTGNKGVEQGEKRNESTAAAGDERGAQTECGCVSQQLFFTLIDCRYCCTVVSYIYIQHKAYIFKSGASNFHLCSKYETLSLLNEYLVFHDRKCYILVDHVLSFDLLRGACVRRARLLGLSRVLLVFRFRQRLRLLVRETRTTWVSRRCSTSRGIRTLSARLPVNQPDRHARPPCGAGRCRRAAGAGRRVALLRVFERI